MVPRPPHVCPKCGRPTDADVDHAIAVGLCSRSNVTTAQLRVVETIIRLWRNSGLSPTVREIGDALGISSSATFDHLRELKRKAVIYSDKHARSIRPVGGWEKIR
jgi:hypothetical protein